MVHTLLKDLKRLQALATYLTPHLVRTPIPVGARVSGQAVGAISFPSPYLLVTGHKLRNRARLMLSFKPNVKGDKHK